MSTHENPIRTAIVGLRHNHIRSIIRYAEQTGRLSIVGVVESDQALRRELEEQLGIPGFDSLHQLLAHVAVEAVALAPVNSEKAQLAVECMEAGLHVIVDKPLAVSWEQLESLHSAYERTERILSLMLPLRFTPCYATARRLVHEGAIGRLVHAWLTRPHKLLLPTRPDWMFQRATYGGLIPDLAIHDIDYFRSVVGATSDDIEHLFALHGNYGASGEDDFEDAAHILLRLKDGTVGSFEANWYTPAAAPYHGDCRAVLTGERGTIEVDTVGDRVILTTDTKPPTEVPLIEPPCVEDDFVIGIQFGPEFMLLPPEEALESIAWTLMARSVADGHGVARRRPTHTAW